MAEVPSTVTREASVTSIVSTTVPLELVMTIFPAPATTGLENSTSRSVELSTNVAPAAGLNETMSAVSSSFASRLPVHKV